MQAGIEDSKSQHLAGDQPTFFALSAWGNPANAANTTKNNVPLLNPVY
jgi:hypothetical protein